MTTGQHRQAQEAHAGAVTGDPRLTGVAAGIGGMNVKGPLTGLVADQGFSLGGRLVANFQAIRTGTVIYAGIGGSGTTANSAVIQGGHFQPPRADRQGK